MGNAYCDRLGITPPRLLDVAIGPSRKHLDALVLVLLAKGEPMDLDEIVGVLAPMWNGTPRDLRVTIQKAWAGREPVVKDADGRYALDLREEGRLALNPAATADLAAIRSRIRELALPRTRVQAERAWHREHEKKLDDERAAKLAARLAAAPPQPDPVKPSKTAWQGTIVAVQPRIRLTRSFDQRSHTYLGYALRLRGVVGDEAREFVVAFGPAAHEKHQFRVGDEVIRFEVMDCVTGAALRPSRRDAWGPPESRGRVAPVPRCGPAPVRAVGGRPRPAPGPTLSARPPPLLPSPAEERAT